MPIHDWTKVDAGIFHHFHRRWVGEICDALNEGLLPGNYYAILERRTSSWLDKEICDRAQSSDIVYSRLNNRVAIRTEPDDSLVAVVEIPSQGDRSTKRRFVSFCAYCSGLIRSSVQLLVIDLYSREGLPDVHKDIWRESVEDEVASKEEFRLNLVSYNTGEEMTAYCESVSVGDMLHDMPLFLGPDRYVSLPLEKTYSTAYRRVPLRWRKVIEDK